MSVDIVQNDRNDMELAGVDGRGNGFLHATVGYNPASNATNIALVATRAFRVKTIIGRVNVAGTDAGAVTAQVFKAANGTALASGTVLHSSTFNLKGTAATNQTLTLSTTDTDLMIAQGDIIGVVLTGVLTTATGAITVALTPR
jgi:hypothetical protein